MSQAISSTVRGLCMEDRKERWRSVRSRKGNRNCQFKSQVKIYDGLKNKCVAHELLICTYYPRKKSHDFSDSDSLSCLGPP